MESEDYLIDLISKMNDIIHLLTELRDIQLNNNKGLLKIYTEIKEKARAQTM